MSEAKQSGALGHETKDAQVGAIAKFALGLAMLSAVVLALMWLMMNFLEKQYARATPPPSPLAAQRPVPPGPLLQVKPEKDIRQLRAAEDSLLQSYGWVLREANLVRIPIARALELTAQRGLPFKINDRGSKIENGGSRP